jgi:hypothetical protein
VEALISWDDPCALGHEVRLMPARYVKRYVKTNKNDYIDAKAIAEAVVRPRMRFVPIKSEDQLDMQSLHRVRERWIKHRTSVVNQIRSLLLERGVTVRKGRKQLVAVLPGILEESGYQSVGAVARTTGAAAVGDEAPRKSDRRSRLGRRGDVRPK